MLYLLLVFLFLVIAIAFVKQQTVNILFHFSHRISGKPHVGIWFYAILFFPGTLLHELSHFFAAELLRVKTGEVHLFPKQEEGYVKLGHVTVAKADPIRSLLIGTAPFLVGITLLCVFITLHFQGLQTEPFSFETITTVFFTAIKDPLTWLLFYFIIVISHAMFLSENDRKEILVVPVTLAFLAALFYFAKGFISIPHGVVNSMSQVLALITLSLTVVLVFNIVIYVILLVMKKGLDKIF